MLRSRCVFLIQFGYFLLYTQVHVSTLASISGSIWKRLQHPTIYLGLWQETSMKFCLVMKNLALSL